MRRFEYIGIATLALGLAMLLFDFGAVLYAINYLSLRQAITPDRLLGRMTATMRFLTVAAAPLGSLAGGGLATRANGDSEFTVRQA